MLDVEKYGKQTVHDLLLKHLIVINAGWFKFENLIRATHPEVLAGNGYVQIMEELCSDQARGLARVLGVQGDGIDSMIELLRCSQWGVFERFEIERLSETSCLMRIMGCSTQRAARKWGMDHYACAEATMVCLGSFCKQVNRDATIHKIFAPPEVDPVGNRGQVSCEWVISIDGTPGV
ncbi:MAG: DUF6125 family protein [Syntrophales bacterium]|jgi:hypothetical protein|nr:DUF6125 family protein [Syntrophales bacterium]MDD4338484.1 DUF6125 family protein [Syntrophales bacterium]HOG07002.1 DUF6125 family protein [Syntrophales bacterium]HPB70631.1 DUF6125 family protein [Syntrophales bacterium]HQN24955.1 DUF6125 family protein [Syntrophales bacterium]